MSEYTKQRFQAEGTVTVNGSDIPYTTISEDFPIAQPNGQIDGTTFTYAYIRADIEDYDGRPVLFAWNGGPGAASVFVHMGLLAPQRVRCGTGLDMPQTPPFSMVENDHCLLDVCDIVVVDAMGTGYAKVFSEEGKKYWFSSDRDAEAIVQTIRRWLSANKRWNSPIYVMGESYGTIRNALVAESAFINSSDAAMMHLSGIIMIGTALDYGQKEFPIHKSVLNLPSIAAAHWYHHPEGKPALREFVDECDAFCYNEYLRALGLGKRMPEEERRAVAEKLSYYTGYDADALLDENLVTDIFAYPARGLAKDGKSVGMYDARYTLGKYKHPEKYDYFSDDASNALAMPAFLICFNAFWKDRLNIDIEDEYHLIDMATDQPGAWDFKTKSYPPEALENAMHRNPNLKVMFVMGLYDMLTTVGWSRYLMSHYDYPSDRLTAKYYEGGHMPYLSDAEAAHLQDDLRAFISA